MKLAELGALKVILSLRLSTLALALWAGASLGRVQAQGDLDHLWLVGFDRENGTSNIGGVSILDFRQATISRFERELTVRFLLTAITISDRQGIRFATNGWELYAPDLSRVPGGDSLLGSSNLLRDRYFYGWDASLYGYPERGATLVLPDPAHVDRYYVLAAGTSYWPKGDKRGGSVGLRTSFLTSSVVKTSRDPVRPEVSLITKDRPWAYVDVLGDSLEFAISMHTAMRHGNGRDWWYLRPEQREGRLHIGLLDSASSASGAGPHLVDRYDGMAHFGPIYSNTRFRGGGGMVTHPRGGQVAMYSAGADVELLNFDRCTGSVSNYRRLVITDISDTLASRNFTSCAYSPSGRYLYVASMLKVYQVDLESPDLDYVTVATQTSTSAANYPSFHRAVLAPDGRVYISSSSTYQHYHAIVRPDEAGAACGFKPMALALGTIDGGCPPLYPDYRLGAKVGSPCDTLGRPRCYVPPTPAKLLPLDTLVVPSAEQVRGEAPMLALRAWPNPAQAGAYVTLEGGPGVGLGSHVTLVDALGREVLREPTVWSGGCGADVYGLVLPKGLTPGAYRWVLREASSERVVATAAMVVW